MTNEKSFAVHKIAERHFRASGPGTLITNSATFFTALQAALNAGQLKDPSVGGRDGQMLVPIPIECVSGAFTELAGVNPADVRATVHRGHFEFFVPREKYAAMPVSSAKVVLYTRQAVKDDPQWDGTEPEADYVIVTVLAQVTERDPVSCFRFCENLAGGNNRYLAPNYTLEKAREEAKQVAEFEAKYIKLG